MQERDPLSLGADSRLVIYQLNTRLAATLERGVQIVDRKADMVDARPSIGHEPANRRSWLVCLEKLHERAASAEPRDVGSVGIGEGDLVQFQHIAVKRKAPGECLNSDANMRNSGAART